MQERLGNFRRRNFGSAVIILAAVLFVGVWIGKSLTKPEGEVELTPQVEPSADFQDRLQQAREAQSKSDWDTAGRLYRQLQRELTVPPHAASLREEIDRNLDALPRSDGSVPIGEEVAVVPKGRSPEKISEEVLIERYPQGKAIASIGRFHVTGTGRNTAWGLRGSAAFNYESEVEITTRVIDSDPKHGRLVFEQTFGDVVQLCAISEHTLELVGPDAGPFTAVGQTADGYLQRLIPQYRAIRRGIDMLQIVDPNLKRIMTSFRERLRSNGIKLDSADEVQFLAQVEKLTGAKFRIVYLGGLGVTSITQTGGERNFGRDELARLAYSSTLMADYFLFPLARRIQGESWEVHASDMGSLVAMYDPMAEIEGNLRLRRDEDDETGKIVRLGITGGTLEARGTTEGKRQEGRLTVRDGFALFDLTDYYVRQAHLNFTVLSLYQSRNHLLFGTDELRDLKVESHYRARLPGDDATQTKSSPE